MKAIYIINANNLLDLLTLSIDISNTTGIKPNYLDIENGQQLKYKPADAKKVLKGDMTPEIYIKNNLEKNKIKT